MLRNELETLRQAEARCRELLSRAEEERLLIESAAKKEAEQEYRRLVEQARKEGEALLEQARAQALLEKQLGLDALSQQVAAMRRQSQMNIRPAAQQIVERMCNGDDCADEPVQPFDVKTG